MTVMTDNSSVTVLRSRIIKTQPTAWKELVFLQGEDFKEFSTSAREKLKASILENEFSEPFYVWHDEAADIRYCLDGKHRTAILQELVAEGVNVPELLPATFVECADKQEAAKLVLQYSSIYARITNDGLGVFLDTFDLKFDYVNTLLDLPGISSSPVLPMPTDLEDDGKNKPAVMKITFESAQDCETATTYIENILKQHFPGAFFSVSCGEI